jgi:ubiquinone biosynthesis protein COQ4
MIAVLGTKGMLMAVWAFRRILRVAAATKCIAILLARPARRTEEGPRFLLLTEGDTFEQAFAAFADSESGARLLRDRPDSIGALRDRKSLSRLAPGTLGRSYLDFMTAHAIDETLYLKGATAAGQAHGEDRARGWFRVRVEAAHDLRHVLTGYGIDTLGEICLVAYRYGQTRHAGTAFMMAMGSMSLAISGPRGAIASVREALRLGRSARLLDLLPWEDMLDQPLATARRAVGIVPPERYLSVVRATAPADPDRLPVAA